jgi:thiamine-phosphate pyrophosphorylase
MTDDTVDADWEKAASDLPPNSAVILRHRDASLRAAAARALRPICRSRRVALLISDDLALALRCGADGVHIPEARAQLVSHARRMNPNWLVTMSAHGGSAMLQAERQGADAVLISPVFPTRSHAGASALGPVGLAALASAAKIPVIALGGITATNVERLQATPVAGLALIRGWLR